MAERGKSKAAISRERTDSPSIQIVRLNCQIEQQHEHHTQNSSAQGPTSQSQSDVSIYSRTDKELVGIFHICSAIKIKSNRIYGSQLLALNLPVLQLSKMAFFGIAGGMRLFFHQTLLPASGTVHFQHF